MLWPTMERIETLQRSGKSITGVPSGFVDLDDMTTGFQPSELVIVAARPSMGKTAFCLNIATHAAVEGHGVAIFSLEMSKDALVQRMLCAEARVDSQAVRRGQVRDADFTQLARGRACCNSCPVWIDDTPGADTARNAQQGAPAEGGERRAADRRRLPPADAEPGVCREPGAGDLGHLPLAQGAGARTGRAGDRAVAACPARRSSGAASGRRCCRTSAIPARSSRTPTW